MYDKDDLGSFVSETAPAVQEDKQYFIKVGDILDIVLLYHKDLSTLGIPVRTDGKISLPHVGDAQAAGLTPMGLDSTLTERFAEILREPSLSVIVKLPAKKVVYVLGEVEVPGGKEFERDVTLIQAIAEAGGFTNEAKGSHSVVIRREGETKIVGVEVDVNAILDGSAVYNNIPLRDYDIVYVPRGRIHSVSDFAKAVKEITSLPIGWYSTSWQLRNLQASYEFFKTRTD
jgi:polysaccharide export outer membrane protein